MLWGLPALPAAWPKAGRARQRRPLPELPPAGAIRRLSASCTEAARPPVPSTATLCGCCHRPHRGAQRSPAPAFGPQLSPKPPSCAPLPASNVLSTETLVPSPGQRPLPAACSPRCLAEMHWQQQQPQNHQSCIQHTGGSALLSWDGAHTRRREPRPALGSTAGPRLPVPASRRCPALSPAAPGGLCPGSRRQ